jgi:hypothetical protein
LTQAYPSTEAQYFCRTISDLDYWVLGVSSCISHAKSWREFLQHHIDSGSEGTTVDLFFNSLKSGRRLTNLLAPLNTQLLLAMTQKVEDPFAVSGDVAR